MRYIGDREQWRWFEEARYKWIKVTHVTKGEQKSEDKTSIARLIIHHNTALYPCGAPHVADGGGFGHGDNRYGVRRAQKRVNEKNNGARDFAFMSCHKNGYSGRRNRPWIVLVWLLLPLHIRRIWTGNNSEPVGILCIPMGWAISLDLRHSRASLTNVQ